MGSGLWLAVADRDVALAAPGSYRAKTYERAVNGESKPAPWVAGNCAAVLDLSEWKFGGCCGPLASRPV